MNLLKVSDISRKAGGLPILKDINFELSAFERIAIAGETGSGKSTLMKIIAGLEQPDAGEVRFEDKRVEGPLEKLVPGHPGIAYLSQHFELPRFLRVEQVLMYTNVLTEDAAKRVYDICKISHLLFRRTDQLSGGERQRIAMARLLISAPRLLLLDEPFSNLDMIHKSTLKAVIEAISEELRITCMLVSHDPTDTLSWADQILVMRGGEVLQQGTPEQIYHQPDDSYVAGLFGRYSLLHETDLKDFGNLSHIDASVLQDRALFVRPERFRLVDDNADGAVQAVVNKVSFSVGFYELEVSLPGGAILTVRSDRRGISKGDQVWVSLPEAFGWLL